MKDAANADPGDNLLPKREFLSFVHWLTCSSRRQGTTPSMLGAEA